MAIVVCMLHFRNLWSILTLSSVPFIRLIMHFLLHNLHMHRDMRCIIYTHIQLYRIFFQNAICLHIYSGVEIDRQMATVQTISVDVSIEHKRIQKPAGAHTWQQWRHKFMVLEIFFFKYISELLKYIWLFLTLRTGNIWH